MIDKSSNIHTGTCTNITTVSTTLRSVLNNINENRGRTYIYPQKMIIDFLGKSLEELGFSVTVSAEDNYSNHVVLNDYSEDVVLQLFNSTENNNRLGFLFPRNPGAVGNMGSFFNSGIACRVTIRMIGQGVGKTRNALILGQNAVPQLTNIYIIYFTTVKYLPTGEEKKAAIITFGAECYFTPYDIDWTFLPGFSSKLNTLASGNTYWQLLGRVNNEKTKHDPFSSYYLLRNNDFPVIPVTTMDGLWEFPDIIMNPYGFLSDDSTSETTKYNFSSGVIYEIGDGKYLCYSNSVDAYLLRLE